VATRRIPNRLWLALLRVFKQTSGLARQRAPAAGPAPGQSGGTLTAQGRGRATRPVISLIDQDRPTLADPVYRISPFCPGDRHLARKITAVARAAGSLSARHGFFCPGIRQPAEIGAPRSTALRGAIAGQHT